MLLLWDFDNYFSFIAYFALFKGLSVNTCQKFIDKTLDNWLII